ncbi:MAG: glycosyltransferase family 4 protein [Proteobacteria bacterium]|nr:glycosyltransferase family 4 protein [Pseudomonadota bacterium]
MSVTYSMPSAVLQVLPKLGAGGVEQGTIDIAKALIGNGYRSLVASQGGMRVEELMEAGAHHVTLPLASKNPVKILGENTKALHSLIVEEKITLVHARSRAPAWSAYRAARLAGVPFVTTFHGTYNFSNFAKKWYNSVMVRGARVIAISDFIKDHILDNYGSYITEDRITVIPRGIDLSRFDPSAIDEHAVRQWRMDNGISLKIALLVMPGRLTRWKGHSEVLRAFSRLVPGSAHLAIIGDHQGRVAYLDELQALARTLGVAPYVSFLDHTNQMPLVYASAQGVVHASTDAEAFGRVVAEAQAMGKPCLVSKLGAPKEIVLEDETGWVADPHDARDLYEGLQELLNVSPDRLGYMAHLARARVLSLFSLEQMTGRTLELYKDLLETHHREA